MKNLIFLLLLASITLNAQTFDKQKMDRFFELLETEQKGMGSLSIFKDGKELYQKSIGYLSIEDDIKSNDKTAYRIGSISKTLTATIILKLAEERKLSLEDKLSKYFSDLPNANDITIEMLLKHRSGLFNFTDAPEYLDYMEKPHSREDLLSIFKKNGYSFKPNSKAEYSNTNYSLLAFIAEDVSKLSYYGLVQTYIIKPLDLKFTDVGEEIRISHNQAKSYTKLGNWVPATQTHMSVPIGAGSIISTPTELNIFFDGLFKGKLISISSLNRMCQIVEDYGMGIFTFPFHDKTAYGHNGGIDGFNSMSCYFKDEDVAITYLSNGVDYNVNDIIIGALSIYFSTDYDLPEFIATIKLNEEELRPFIGVYKSPTFPLDITITVENNILICQATDQPSFPLEATSKNTFKFDAAQLEIEFPEENKLILKQAGGVFELKKK